MGMGQYVFSSYFAQVEAGFIPDAEVNGHQVWGGYGGVSIDFLRERYTDKGILPGRPGQNDQKIVFSGRRLVHAEVGHDGRGHGRGDPRDLHQLLQRRLLDVAQLLEVADEGLFSFFADARMSSRDDLIPRFFLSFL